jgi:hypothetical protein
VRFTTLCKYAEALGARCDVAFVFRLSVLRGGWPRSPKRPRRIRL